MKDQFHIQWHITNLCNLRCQHCYQEDFSKDEDLDWQGLRRVSDNILLAMNQWDKTVSIHLTGGEPLLRPEVFLLLDYLDQKDEVQELGIITNGLYLDQNMTQKLSDFPKLRKLKISLDGANAEIHDSIRRGGVFEKVIRNLSLIQRNGRFEITLMFTVMKRNYRNVDSLLGLCKALGLNGLILERFIPLGKGRGITQEVLDRDQWKEVVERVLQYLSMEAEEDHFFTYQAFQVSFNRQETELLGASCIVGTDGICLLPGGDILPCRRFPIVIGNALKDPLAQVWEKSVLLKTLRRKENLKGQCGRCQMKDCRGCRSLALSITGDYLGEDPHCWSHPE